MNRIETACLNDIDVKDFYWNADAYIESAINEHRCFVIKDNSMIMGAMIMEFYLPNSSLTANPIFSMVNGFLIY